MTISSGLLCATTLSPILWLSLVFSLEPASRHIVSVFSFSTRRKTFEERGGRVTFLSTVKTVPSRPKVSVGFKRKIVWSLLLKQKPWLLIPSRPRIQGSLVPVVIMKFCVNDSSPWVILSLAVPSVFNFLSLTSNKSTATFGEIDILAGSILEKSSWLMMLFVAPVSNSASKWTSLLSNGILGILEYTWFISAMY